MDSRIGIDPAAEAGKRVAAHWMEEAYSGRDLPASIRRFEQARALDPSIRIESFSANELCWACVQRGYAKQALGVCNAAVASDDKNWMARDSRGVARVLTGDITGAIEDFEFYVKSSDRVDTVKQRERWIALLEGGWRPQSFAELDKK
jgi:hypothetical protein